MSYRPQQPPISRCTCSSAVVLQASRVCYLQGLWPTTCPAALPTAVPATQLPAGDAPQILLSRLLQALREPLSEHDPRQLSHFSVTNAAVRQPGVTKWTQHAGLDSETSTAAFERLLSLPANYHYGPR